jgi:hypothetical protein
MSPTMRAAGTAETNLRRPAAGVPRSQSANGING